MSAGLFTLTCLAGVGVTARTYMLTLASERIVAALRKRLFSSVLSQPETYLDKTPTGDLITRLGSDCHLVRQTMTTDLVSGLRGAFMATGGTVMIISSSPYLAAVSLCTLPPVFLMAKVFGARIKSEQKMVQARLSDSTALAEEVISGLGTARSFNREQQHQEDYSDAIDGIYKSAVSAGRQSSLFDGGVHVAANASALAVLAAGGKLVLEGAMTSGELASFMMYSLFVAGSTAGLSSTYGEVMKSMAAATRVFQVIDQVPEMEEGDILDFRNADIEFDDVHFAYSTRPDVQVLKGCTLKIPAGTHIALVGASGSGKSTLASLINRTYDADKGSVRVGGSDVRRYTYGALRGGIGVVSQSPVLFTGSVRDNISYGADPGSPPPTPDAVEAAARAASVHDIGLDVHLGEKGVQLSGGQRQRVAVARVLLKDCPFVVFDEATSALDAESEAAVQAAVEGLGRGGKTVVSVAHRLSTIKSADVVAVLKGGRIVEVGGFDELIEKDGEFKRLVDKQLLQSKKEEKQN